MRLLAFILCASLAVSVEAQTRPVTLQCYGTYNADDLCIYDGTVDNRFEFLDASTLVTNLCTDLLQCETPTDDGVPVGNATSFDIKVVPDCDTALTSKLLYDTTANAFSCGTDTDTDTDTNTNTLCTGTQTYSDGEGNCDTLDGAEDFEAATADGVLVGDGSVFNTKVLTDCDSSTSAINYDVSTDAFSCRDLSASLNPFGASIDDTELTNEDFGNITCTGLEDGCTIDSGTVADEDLANEDFGEFTCTGADNTCTIDDGVIADEDLNAEDYGDFTCDGADNGCTVDDLSVEYNTDVTGAADGVATIVSGVGVIQNTFVSLEGELTDLNFGTLAEDDILIVDSSNDIIDQPITTATENNVAFTNLSDVGAWTDWSATAAFAAEGGTWDAAATIYEYMVMGKQTCINLRTTAADPDGAADYDYVTVTLPSTYKSLAGSLNMVAGFAYINYGASEITGVVIIPDNTATMRIHRMPDIPVFVEGTNVTLSINICYPTD